MTLISDNRPIVIYYLLYQLRTRKKIVQVNASDIR